MQGFVARHKGEWDELEGLVRAARKSPARLSAAERRRLDVLYRRTATCLARIDTRGDDGPLAAYLHGIVAAAHSVIYRPRRQSLWKGGLTFLVNGFARSVARRWRLHALSGLLFLAGLGIGFGAARSDPVIAHALWADGDPRQPGATDEQLKAVLRHGRDGDAGEKFGFASMLFQHNLKVGLLSLAGGALAGIPPVFLMLFNGLHLGSFVAIHDRPGMRAETWAWLLPHGVTELLAVVLCGGAGLVIGAAFVSPGRVSRWTALARAGREAAAMCAGIALMLVAAAVLESYLRQSHLSTAQRLTFAAATALFWAAYFGRGAVLERAAAADGPFTERSVRAVR
jgi:uncharacterized membrane protein SpoIIM required for sporulation